MSAPPGRKHLLLATLAAVALAFVATVARVQIESLPLRDGHVMQNGKLLGGDFIAFYTAGKLFERHPDRLYDLEFQREVRSELLGPAESALGGELPFVYPPLVAAAMSLLSPFPFWLAFVLFAAIALLAGTAMTDLAASSFGDPSRLLRGSIALLLWGFIPFSVNTVLGGQLPWLGMICLGGVFWALQSGRPFVAGLAMSLSYYKPPLFLLALVVLLLTEGRRFVGGFAVGAIVLVSLSALAVGVSGLGEFLEVVSRYTYGQDLFEGVELPPASGAGVYGLLTTLAGGNGLLATSLLAALFVTAAGILVHTGRRRVGGDPESRAVWLGVLWVGSVGLSLQCIRYDLALLFIPLMALARTHRRFAGPARGLLLGSLAGFYLEFMVRERTFGDYTLNLSSLLFLVLLPVGLLTLLRHGRSAVSEKA